MKFIIRDDDLSYFSKPADIDYWYSDLFAQQIPVGFSAIPFVKGTSDVYPRNGVDKEFPISNNQELISYIIKNNLIEIFQHGCTHETKNGTFEYAENHDLIQDTLRGKIELEKAFGTKIKIFIPPHDWINKNGIEAIEAVGLDLIRGRGTGLKNLKFSFQYISNTLKMIFDPFYPFVLNYGKHKEMRSFRLEDAGIFEGFKHAQDKNGIFVVVVHLHYYTKEKKGLLLKLIDRAKNYSAEFVKAGSIFS